MDDKGLDDLSKYAKVNSLILDTYGEKCLDVKYSDMIKDLRQTSWNSSAAEGGNFEIIFNPELETIYLPSFTSHELREVPGVGKCQRRIDEAFFHNLKLFSRFTHLLKMEVSKLSMHGVSVLVA